MTEASRLRGRIRALGTAVITGAALILFAPDASARGQPPDACVEWPGKVCLQYGPGITQAWGDYRCGPDTQDTCRTCTVYITRTCYAVLGCQGPGCELDGYENFGNPN
jgi:hypothetical protein